MTAKPKPPPEKLSPEAARVEHARLGAEIAGHDRRYHGEDAPTISDAEYDALRRRYGALEAALPELADAGLADAQGRRGAGGGIRQGPPRRADAVARQRLRRRRGRGILRPRAPLPRPERRRAARLHRRAEDRRPLLLAALRARQARPGGDARRRLRGRGRHRQRAHDRRDPADARRRARRARGARRSLYGQRRFRRAQRAPAGGRQAGSSPIRATPPPARCASSIPRSPPGGR